VTRILPLAFLLALATASCGGAAGHTHGGFEIPEGEAVPTVEVLATQDAVSGWNLQVITTDFIFAPERAGREFVLGEGHAHLYVDGEKRDRLYGPWYHLDNLAPGEHTIEVTLNGNNHAVYQSGGRPISHEITIDGEEQSHPHEGGVPVEAGPDMAVVLDVEKDPVGGWTVYAETSGFTWAPQSAGLEHVTGEGHAHLYVDDQKVGRIYGSATYLGPLTPGSHTITVSLHANNHAPYVREGEPVAATAVVEEKAATGQERTTVAVEVRDGRVVGTTPQVEVALGDTVELGVTSDRADAVHVHGYEVIVDVSPNIETTVEFVANIPGVFEIELEDSGVLLVSLTVR
jgi:hypothetical protein